MREAVTAIWRIAQAVSKAHDLDPVLVLAIIEQESGYEPTAMRHEPGYLWLWPSSSRIKAPPGVSIATERNQQATSWGLMQVMGAVARERGCELPFLSALCSPALGIKYGCLHLAALKRRWRNRCDHVSAYNAGHPTPANGQYVANVLARVEKLRRVIDDQEPEPWG